MYKFILGVVLSTFFIMTGCAQKNDRKDYVVTIKTGYGDMVAILYDETPKHKENFIKLAKEHYFDGLLFHRIIQGFMIQGGDPNSKNAKPGERLGTGGPGYTIDAEFNPKFYHEKGALSAARMGDQVNPTKASSGSQFYIVQGTVYQEENLEELKIDGEKLNMAFQQMFQKPENKAIYDSLGQLYRSGDAQGYQDMIKSLIPRAEKETGIKIQKDIPDSMIKAYTTVGGAPHLDGQYTVFGKVIKGLEVIDKIAALPKDMADRPTEDVFMTVTVEELSRHKIEKEYGYQYPETK